MAILANEKILTLDYWKPAYKVQPGDYVFNKDGKLVKVKLVQEYQAESCYEVTFNDHLTAAGDSNLGFLVETPKYRIRICTYKGKQRFRRPLKHFKTTDLVNAHLKDRRSRSLFSVPTARPLELPHQTLPVPPFIAGFWFFNQRANKKMAAPRGMAEVVHQQFRDHGYEITTGRRINTGEKEFSVFPTVESHFAPFIPTKIPENYILASVEQRIELLRGIIHAKSRQYSPRTDTFRVSGYHGPTIRQVQALVESLGCRSTLIFDDIIKNYVLSFKSKIKLVENQVSKPVKVHYGRRYISKVTPIASQKCVHIQTEEPNTGILVGEGFISCL